MSTHSESEIKIKIAHLSSVHIYNDTRIFHKMCRTLSDEGYDVTLIARAEEEQVVDGIRIIPFPAYASKFQRFLKAPWRMFRMARRLTGTRLFHLHDPELIPTAILLRLTGRKVIYDVHEKTPDTMYSKNYLNPALANFFYYAALIAEWLAGKVVNHVIVVIPSLLDRFPRRKTGLVQNFAYRDELLPEGYDVRTVRKKRQITYIGDITRVRGVKEAIMALELLPADYDVTFTLAGRFGDKKVEQECRDLDGWKRVRFLGYIDRQTVAKELLQSVAGVILLHPTPDHIGSQAVKLYEYMLAGLPVIVSDIPVMNTIVDETGCGYKVDPFRPDDIAAVYRKVLDNEDLNREMGDRGRKAVLEKYNWESQIPVLLDVYKKVTG